MYCIYYYSCALAEFKWDWWKIIDCKNNLKDIRFIIVTKILADIM